MRDQHYIPSIPRVLLKGVGMGDKVEILGEQMLYQNGSFHKIRRWLRGVHPEFGIIVQGYTGWETMVDADVIKPMITVHVIPEVPPILSVSEEKIKGCHSLQSVA